MPDPETYPPVDADVIPDAEAPVAAVDPNLVVPGSLAAAVPVPITVEKAKSKRLGIVGWFAIGWLIIVMLMAVVPGIFPGPGLTERSREAIVSKQLGPQAGHPLGLDQSGYDMLTKVIYGARASMIVSVGAITFAFLIGGFLGLIAGYFKGKLDTLLTGMFNVMLAMPALVLALTLATVFASGAGVSYNRRVTVVTIAIGIVSIPILGRITRANTLAWSEREFVLAARLLGTKTHRIIWREVLPNVLPSMLSIALLGIGVAIVAEGGLSLLGVGVPASIDSPSWGNLIASLRSQLFLGRPWGVFAPSTAIFLTVLSLNYLGDVVRARFDVRESVL
ncbi:MAG TPA: ABC transporter permease [Acidimicrobiales bacterium]|nr:ABC transporter permease [Acidimicrobiales bacterium]